MGFPFSGYQSNVPQARRGAFRTASRPKDPGRGAGDLCQRTLQVYLGSTYVQRFSIFFWAAPGVCMRQAEGDYRKKVEGLCQPGSRENRRRAIWLPIGSMVNIKQSYGPDPVIRYNGYPGRRFVGEANPSLLSSAQADGQGSPRSPARCCRTAMSLSGTDLRFSGKPTQGTASRCSCFPVAILLAFLVARCAVN